MTTIEPDWEERNAELWGTVEERTRDQFMAEMEALVAELPPGSALRPFELGSANDSTGRVGGHEKLPVVGHETAH